MIIIANNTTVCVWSANLGRRFNLVSATSESSLSSAGAFEAADGDEGVSTDEDTGVNDNAEVDEDTDTEVSDADDAGVADGVDTEVDRHVDTDVEDIECDATREKPEMKFCRNLKNYF